MLRKQVRMFSDCSLTVASCPIAHRQRTCGFFAPFLLVRVVPCRSESARRTIVRIFCVIPYSTKFPPSPTDGSFVMVIGPPVVFPKGQSRPLGSTFGCGSLTFLGVYFHCSSIIGRQGSGASLGLPVLVPWCSFMWQMSITSMLDRVITLLAGTRFLVLVVLVSCMFPSVSSSSRCPRTRIWWLLKIVKILSWSLFWELQRRKQQLVRSQASQSPLEMDKSAGCVRI